MAELSVWIQLVPRQVAGDHTCPGPGPALPDMPPQALVGKGSRVDLDRKFLETQFPCLTLLARWQQIEVIPRQSWGPELLDFPI